MRVKEWASFNGRGLKQGLLNCALLFLEVGDSAPPFPGDQLSFGPH